MPEICEVAITTHFIYKYFKNYTLTDINILGGRYIHQELKGLDNIVQSMPLKLLNVSFKGKFMWFKFENNNYILNTLGLTGYWGIDENIHNRVEFVFKKNKKIKKLFFGDMRNFGTIECTDTVDKVNSKINKLAMDPLQTDYTCDDFYDLFDGFRHSKKRKSMKIIKLLMGQNKSDGIVCGLGNYLAPEILARAKISPHRTLESLNKKDIIKLCEKMKYILKLCYINNPSEYYLSYISGFIDEHKSLIEKNEFENFIPEIVIDDNDKFEFIVYRQKEDKKGNKIMADKIINGRTTYWNPTIQK